MTPVVRGRSIDVGGYRLHAVVDGAGEPTVVFLAGLGAWSSWWSLVSPDVARETRVVTYDRAGLGHSEPGPPERDAARAVRDLRALLALAAVDPPFVLVGHSQGGLQARLFASTFPDEVAGLVLVDASHEEMGEDIPPLRGAARVVAPVLTSLQLAINRLVERFGRTRVARPFVHRRFAKFPHEVRDEIFEVIRRREFWDTVAQERDARPVNKTQLREARSARPFPAVPLVSIAADGPQMARLYRVSAKVLGTTAEAFREERLAFARDEAVLSPHGTLVLARNSGHNVPYDEPEVVVQAVLDVLTATRSAS